MDALSHSLPSALQRISLKWLVGILLLISMLLQLVLVILGARRYHSSRAIFHFAVWGAYISADVVAISALGSMMHSCTRSDIFGIWAPVLLLHLGGPDAITAYSVADNDLWMRHGFNMLYQVSVVMYVIYSLPLKGSALVSAVLLMVAGATKYGERTLALWFASDSKLVTSCLPISRYMKRKSVVEDRGYLVMGEKQVKKMIEKKFNEESSKGGRGMTAVRMASSSTGRGKEAGIEASSSKERDIEVGREASPVEGRAEEEIELASLSEGRDIETGQEVPSVKESDIEVGLKGRGIITTGDVQKAGINGENYNLCLSHALSKMYMRRFVGLYFDEGDWKETREFWFMFSGNDAFRIVETELQFMYDVLFSKGSGTAFSFFGITLRLLNCVLMGAAGFLILRERHEERGRENERGQTEAQQMVTYVVISVALLVEVFQFCRILISDWTRVRLICARVERNGHPFSKAIDFAVLALGKAQRFVGGDRNLSNGVHQHCLIGTCLNRSRFLWKVVKFFPKVDHYIASWHTDKVCVGEELKEFIFDILMRKCSPRYDSETCRGVIYNFEEDLLENEPEIKKAMPSHDNLEEVILVWHIATTICEGKTVLAREDEDENVRRSMILSRYCAYLLVSRPRLLPVHPEMAIITYLQLEKQLMGNDYYGEDPTELLHCNDKGPLGFAAKLARRLLRKGKDEMWKLLALYWAELLLYMAVYNKASFHAECVAGGGEFLSQLWVLLGHIGCGEQSDSAVRKKIEMPMEKERRRRKQEQQRLEGERQETDRQERERLERERMEREQQEQERLRRDDLEWDRREQMLLEQNRKEWDRLERVRLEQKRIEWDNLERERLAREGAERDHLERERLAREHLERDRLEQMRLEENRKEWDGLVRVRLEQNRKEWDRLERVRLEQKRIEWDNLERERLAREGAERDHLERERLAREHLERDRLERDRLERDRLEQERLQQERLEQDRLERERMEQERLEGERLEGSRGVWHRMTQALANMGPQWLFMRNA